MKKLISLVLIPIAALISGCSTTNSISGISQEQITNKLKLFNPFDTTASDLKKLVVDGKMEEADKLFESNYEKLFKLMYVEEKQAVPSEIESLSKWKFDSEYKSNFENNLERIKKIETIGDPATWSETTYTINSARYLIDKYNNTLLARVGTSKPEVYSNLYSEISRVRSLFDKNRSLALSASFAKTIQTGEIPKNYPVKIFTNNDYLKSSEFQSKISVEYNLSTSDIERKSVLDRLSSLVSDDTKKALLDGGEIKKRKEKLLADGRITLDELDELRNIVEKYGSASGLGEAVKIGYVDLTASSFRDRNIFDYQIEFVKDYGITLIDAKDDLMNNGKLTSYDYVFVTDLSSAKITREFKNKQDKTSKAQTGTRQELNPAYSNASNEYQIALNEMQNIKIRNSIEGSKPCYGNVWVCALAAGLRGRAFALEQHD